MKKTKGILCFITVCLLMLFTAPAAADTAKGSLTVIFTDENDRPVKDIDISLYMVADGKELTDSFKDSPLTFAEITVESDNAKNSIRLYNYITGRDIYSEEKTTDKNGAALYTGLEKGVYLVSCEEGQEKTFDPFLCFVPTRIGNDCVYDIKAFPKTGDNGEGGGKPDTPEKPDTPDVPPFPDEPSVPAGPVNPVNPDTPVTPDIPAAPEGSDKPVIPQTGALRWPVWVMAAAGGLFVAIGIADMVRKERDGLE